MAPESDVNVEAPVPTTGPQLSLVLWGLLLFAGCRFIEVILEAQSMAVSVGQAVLVEWGSARLGIIWTPAGTPATAGLIVKRASFGVAVGSALGLLVFGVVALTRAASISAVSNVAPSVLLIGLVTAALMAWRDELLLHGIVLRVLEPTSISVSGRIVACGVISAGATLGNADVSPQATAVSGLLGMVFGALWLRDGGAWQPWAANTAFRFVTGTVLSGGVLQYRIAENAETAFEGTAAVVTLAVGAAAGLTIFQRTTSPKSSKPG
jgi:hypothetical protein